MSILVLRSDKVAYYGVTVGATTTYHRMTGFTDASISRNPSEYARKYVDRKSETTSVTGYSPSMAYTFDQYTDNPVHDDIVDITENEKTATSAVRNIIVVDFSEAGTLADTYIARKRSYSVIPDSDGSGTDAYQYSGNFKTEGITVLGTASSADDWETITFEESIGTTYLVTFSVNDGTDQLAGATVTIGTTSVNTDDNGIAEFALVNGTYPYEVSLTGYTTDTGSSVVVADAAEYVEVTLVAV